jgi:hypothetical protein
MLRRNDELIINRGIVGEFNFSSERIRIDNTNFINSLINVVNLQNNGLVAVNLPIHPPFEIHPYKSVIQLNNFDKYIIGTFPPISYLYDIPEILAAGINCIRQPNPSVRKIQSSQIPFYHGNRNLMWDYFLTSLELDLLPDDRNNAKLYLINKLFESSTNYADIIDSTQRSLENSKYNGRDKQLHNICINHDLIHDILFVNSRAEFLLFNTASIYSNNGINYENGNIDISEVKSFDLFVRGCQLLDLDVEIRVNHGMPDVHYPWTNINLLPINQRKNKLIFEMKVKRKSNNNERIPSSYNEKIFTVVTPFSPAVAIRVNLLQGNPIVLNWQMMNNGNAITMLADIYQSFRWNNFTSLYNYNS